MPDRVLLRIVVAAVLVTLCAPASVAFAQSRLDGLVDEVRRDFPDVVHLSGDAVRSRLGRDPQSVVLVDVRNADEYQVSRIPGAVHVEDPGAIAALAIERPDRTVVLYCSVGIRSARLARVVQAEGVRNVVNLEGSIFAWANAGHALENDAGIADKVHGYNFWWRGYLEPRYRR